MFQRFYFDREQFIVALYTTFFYITIDLNLKKTFLKARLKRIKERMNIVKKKTQLRDRSVDPRLSVFYMNN